MLNSTFRLPSDILLNSVELNSDQLGSETKQDAPDSSHELDTALKPWISIKKELQSNPNDINKWDELFRVLDNKYQELHSSDQLKDSSSDEFKKIVYDSYSQLLKRFPYYSEYWKKFLIMEYQINGTQSSIDTLNRSITAFPYCLDLWSDYISALISQYELVKDDISKKDEQISFIRHQFKVCLDNVGLHFNSDPLWDKFIAFELSLNDGQESSRDLLNIYKNLIKVPLYQYAQYFKTFTEISKEFEPSHILSEGELNDYIKKFEKSSVDELSLIEKHQIIDDYSYSIFTKNQERVGSKWAYESSITYPDFSIANYTAIESETENWEKYLDYEINTYKSIQDAATKEDKSLQFKITTCLFERALIPNCYSSKIWLKYLAFYHIYYENDDIYLKMKKIYDRAINNFIPLDQNYLRYNYVSFLLSHDQFDIANEYSFDLIKLFSGLNNSKLYIKENYLEAVKQLIEMWSKTIKEEAFSKILEDVIDSYFDKIDRYKKEPTKESNVLNQENQGIETEYKIKQTYVNTLQKLLNDESITLIMYFYLNSLKLSRDKSAPLKIRKVFNKYYKEPAIGKSAKFWDFYVKYEGLVQHNFSNLRNIIQFVKSSTSLSKSVIDSILDVNYDIISANYAYTLQEKDITSKSDDSLILLDNNKSNSIAINNSAKERLARGNYIIKGAAKANMSINEKVDELIKLSRKHSDHPGIFVEATPQITNSILNDYKYKSLNDEKVKQPALPSFKNVEKASLPIQYPKN